MHIHKPKVAHSVREFLSEIGIIVVGILIALAGEQLVEWNHAQHQLDEAREALRVELGRDAAGLKAMDAENDCADARLRLLEAWSDGKATINSAHLASMNNRPWLWRLPTTAWDVTKSGAIAAHMPIKERLAYASVYDELENQTGHILDERHAWDLLARYAGKEKLTVEEARNLKADLGSVRIQDDARRFNTPSILNAIVKLGVKPADRPQGPQRRDPNHLCGPPT